MQELLNLYSNDLVKVMGSRYILVFTQDNWEYTSVDILLRWDDAMGLFWFTYDNQTLVCPIASSCIYECCCWVKNKLA